MLKPSLSLSLLYFCHCRNPCHCNSKHLHCNLNIHIGSFRTINFYPTWFSHMFPVSWSVYRGFEPFRSHILENITVNNVCLLCSFMKILVQITCNLIWFDSSSYYTCGILCLNTPKLLFMSMSFKFLSFQHRSTRYQTSR